MMETQHQPLVPFPREQAAERGLGWFTTAQASWRAAKHKPRNWFIGRCGQDAKNERDLIETARMGLK